MKTAPVISVIALLFGSGWIITTASAQQKIAEPPQLQEPPILPSPARSRRALPITGPGAITVPEQPQGWRAPERLQVREERGVRYVSGGIGLNEREELNALSKQFNLRIRFAVQGGNYLADINVDITNASGEKVLSAKSEGPWFFAQLAPGIYRVDVQAMDRAQNQSVRVNAGRQASLNFFWN